MARTKAPEAVKLIVGMLGNSAEIFCSAETDMETLWGQIDIASEILPFTYTDYYEKQMGPRLLRKFVSFAELIDPGALASIKHQSNSLEEKWAQVQADQQPDVARPINLDPGYIEPSKLVLASTKNYSHRIYIGESMYAECTLSYHRGAWQSWPFSYPDYASGDYDTFLCQVRNRLMEQLSSQKQNI